MERKSLLTSLLIAVIICFFWIDRPLAFRIEALHYGYRIEFRLFERIPELFIPTAFVVLCLLGGLGLGARQSRLSDFGFHFSLSIALSAWMQDVLKPVFGRTWPNTWTNGNLSLIRNGVYGFHWFHKGVQYASFPSGHATCITAGMVSLSLFFPRARWLFWLGIVLTELAILLQNFHFLGDLIAGTWLGTAIALSINRFWKIEE
ncbi:phosphatase PAP2 family protein [Pajaroellobacter abortibovis]|uniref:Phosphatidic acid phosphatase type 2/haloperoxidase domain-containing protein n=1 Tax=Pajaroellobacter abortibovis TaxID=1882918 RepID=A0A1L6MV70_9BACT|nr:phosphatase PAP2 family protein [Pajaroellobacter abortibovis]APR99413.1 hypothetical protein BCY86_00995 [Pajaroellobacter abortibovis]